MLRSMYSGVAGLKAHQTMMDVIGNNISNVSTYGFKSSQVSFADMYYQTVSSSSKASTNLGGTNAEQIGYGSKIGAISLNMERSGYASTGKSTDCYISGEGYFDVKDGSGKEYLTRVGQMNFDGSGNLVDNNGYFVCGFPVAYNSSRATINNSTIDFGKENGTLMDGYKINVVYADAAATESTAITADAVNKTVTIAFTPSSAAGSPQTLTNKTLQDALQTGTWTWSGTAPTGFDASKITVSEAAADPNAEVAATSGIAAQAATFDYSAAPEKITNPYGTLINIAVSSDGTITGENQSGKIVSIAQLALANVSNPQGLEEAGNTCFQAGNNAGTISYSAPGENGTGALQTGGLETSNVDLSTELSDMIMTQRGFQANSKIITVSDDMLDTLVNLKR